MRNGEISTPTAKGKTSKRRKLEKMFGLSKKRRIKNSYKKKVVKEREIKFIGKISEPSEFILSLRERKTSPNTLKLQKRTWLLNFIMLQYLHDWLQI